MKKNGKKYRKLQKKREQKQQDIFTNDVDREVDGIKIENLSTAHIVIENPIVFDAKDTKREYLKRLKNYVKLGGWNKRKYEISEMAAYEKIILGSDPVEKRNDIGFYKYFILFDLIHVLGYELTKISESKMSKLKKQYLADFCDADPQIFKRIMSPVQREDRKLARLQKIDELRMETHYIELVRKNIAFKKQKPFAVMVTATMSAGKSTFINSLIGKYVCLSQNMACTNKIHSVINKAFEDGYCSEYDHDLVMTAGKEELLNDNEENQSNMIYVAANYYGGLSDARIIVNDSPGVNFSGDKEHQKIAEQLIKSRKYNMLIYVMNATQLGTNDEDEHLDFIKNAIGRTPIIFVMNKVDAFNPEEENVEAIINRQTEYLKRKGFKAPVVCPVSARAGYLAKQFEQVELSRSEERELYNYVDKFDQMNLSGYYSKTFPQIKIENHPREEVQLLKTCGMGYVEKLIKGYTKGGK